LSQALHVPQLKQRAASAIACSSVYARITSSCVRRRLAGASIACWTRGNFGKYVMFIRFKSVDDVDRDHPLLQRLFGAARDPD